MKSLHWFLTVSVHIFWKFKQKFLCNLSSKYDYSIHHLNNHGCLHSPSSQHRPGTQGTVWEYNEQETAYPEAAFVITGDFNKANFRTIAPKYFQHITINTRGDRVLDHCYSPFRDAYKSLPRPPFGKSDHSSVLLLPAYRQKLKREAPALRTIQCWSDQSDAILQDCFDHVDLDLVPGSIWWRHRGVFRYCNVFHQEVYRGCNSDQNNKHLPQPKTVD